MAAEYRRFTISLTPELEQALDRVKQEEYCNRPQSQMVRELIALGLDAFRKGRASRPAPDSSPQGEGGFPRKGGNRPALQGAVAGRPCSTQPDAKRGTAPAAAGQPPNTCFEEENTQ